MGSVATKIPSLCQKSVRLVKQARPMRVTAALSACCH